MAGLFTHQRVVTIQTVMTGFAPQHLSAIRLTPAQNNTGHSPMFISVMAQAVRAGKMIVLLKVSKEDAVSSFPKFRSKTTGAGVRGAAREERMGVMMRVVIFQKDRMSVMWIILTICVQI